MKTSLAGNRYAKSLLDLAVEQNKLEDVHNDMQFISKLVDDNHDLLLMLESPIVKTDKKEEILKTILVGKISELSTLFVNLITSRKRENLIGDIAKSFIALYRTHKNIITAEVTSAVPLTKEQTAKITGLLATEASSSVEIVETVDPEIIGGFIVRVDDKQIDASIARELADLRMTFSENPYIAEF